MKRNGNDGSSMDSNDANSGVGAGNFSINSSDGQVGSSSERKALLGAEGADTAVEAAASSAGKGFGAGKGLGAGRPARLRDTGGTAHSSSGGDPAAAAAFRKRVVVGAFFLLMTSAQAYVGVKCVLFEFETVPWNPGG